MAQRKQPARSPRVVWRRAKDDGAPAGNKLVVRRWVLPGKILILPYGIRLPNHLLISTVLPDATLALDLAHWPPRFRPVWQHTTHSAALAPDGNWLLCVDTPGEGFQPHDLVITEPGAPGPPLRTLKDPEGRSRGLHCVLRVGEQVIVIAGVTHCDQPDEAYRLDGDALKPATDLPRHPGLWDGGKGRVHFMHGKVTLGDGSEVLIWGGDGYELRGGRFVRTWELATDDEHTVSSGVDGLFFLRDRKLYQARRGQPARPVCPDASEVLGIWPGPEGSVLIHHASGNKRKLEARVWFPEEDNFVFLKKRDLTDDRLIVFGSLHWSEATRHLYIVSDEYLLTIPGDVLLARRHYRRR